MNTISDATFASYDLHPCRVCNSPRKIYTTLSHLRCHQNIHTPPAHPANTSNSHLVYDTFQTSPLLPNHWPHSLEWLSTPKLVPPPFHEFLAKMLWQNQTVSALNIWQPNEAIGAATAMIVCQTKPENMFLIETLCFWAYQNSTLCIF